MITYKLDNLSERDALFRQFPRQYDVQPAYVQMDEDGIVSAYYSGEIGYSVPSYVWHNRTLRWRVHPSTDGHALRDLLTVQSFEKYANDWAFSRIDDKSLTVGDWTITPWRDAPTIPEDPSDYIGMGWVGHDGRP